MILKCNCFHKFQNKTYGKGNRVHNLCKKSMPAGILKARCTVCGNVREILERKKETE